MLLCEGTLVPQVL